MCCCVMSLFHFSVMSWFGVHDLVVLSAEMRKIRENINYFSLRLCQHIGAVLQDITVTYYCMKYYNSKIRTQIA